MTRIKYHNIMVGFGIWVILLPFFGFPSTIIKIIFVVTGIFLFLFGLAARQEYTREKMKGVKTETFVEETVVTIKPKENEPKKDTVSQEEPGGNKDA